MLDCLVLQVVSGTSRAQASVNQVKKSLFKHCQPFQYVFFYSIVPKSLDWEAILLSNISLGCLVVSV